MWCDPPSIILLVQPLNLVTNKFYFYFVITIGIHKGYFLQ